MAVLDAHTGVPVKAYLLYVGREFYPGAVIEDLVLSTDTLEEAHEHRIRQTDPSDKYEWWSIVCHATMQVISEGSETEKRDYDPA